MMQWTVLQHLEAGAYIAIMLAVLGVPQLLSSYFDIRARRADRREDRAEAEAREAAREERHRQDDERHRQDDERRHQDDERRHQDGERRHQDGERRHREQREDDERRHREMMTILAAAVANGRNRDADQSELIRTLQQAIEDLRAENARLKNGRSNGDGQK